jgi:hypothetical protein
MVGASAAGSAFAGGRYEPPDPCSGAHNARAHRPCEQSHPRPLDGSVHFGDGSVHFRSNSGRTER